MNKPGCHRTGLDAHFGVDTSMLRNTSRNWPGIGGADAAPEPLALLVDNADRGRLLRYVQPNIMRHRNLRWCKSPGKMPGSRHYRLLGFEPRLPEVHTITIPLRLYFVLGDCGHMFTALRHGGSFCDDEHSDYGRR